MRFRLAVPALLLFASPMALSAQTAPEQDRSAETAEAAAPEASVGPIDPDTAVEAEEELLVTGDKPKKVCRSVTSLGSRVPQKICRTEKEAREEVLSTREMITERRLMGDKPTEYQGEDTTADGGFDSRVPVADPF